MKDVRKLIGEEAEASEARSDAAIPEGASVTRPNQPRSTVYSVRLNPTEVAALQALAETEGVPASTPARAWVIERLREEQEGWVMPRLNFVPPAVTLPICSAISGARSRNRQVGHLSPPTGARPLSRLAPCGWSEPAL